MTFDKPEHQELAKQLIARATFGGSLLELAMEFKLAVEAAEVLPDPPDAGPKSP